MKTHLLIITMLMFSLLFVVIPEYQEPVSASITSRLGFSIQNGQRTAYSVSDTAWTNVHDDTTANGTGATYWQTYCERKATHFKWQITRCYGFFNTASVPDDATITTISLAFYISNTEQTPFWIYFQNCSNLGADLSTGEFDIANIKSNLSKYWLTTTGYKNVTFTSNLTGFINKTGWTYIVLRSGYDYNNTSPVSGVKTNQYSTNFTTVKLWVTYTLPVVPSVPVYFEARTQNSSWIMLNWTKGASYVKNTVILANDTGYPTLADCIILYNGTGSWYNHTGLVNNTHWFYLAYSWNETDRTYSTTALRSHDTTMGIPIGAINLELHNTTGSYTVEYANHTVYDETADYSEMPADCNDSDWTTFGTLVDMDDFDIHYFIPSGAVGAIWRMKDAEGERNVSIPSNVFYKDDVYLNLSVTCVDFITLGIAYLGEDGVGVDTVIYQNLSTTGDIYEEGITWVYPNGWIINFTSESQLNLTFNLTHATETHHSIWNSGTGFWDILLNATGNQSGLVVSNNSVNVTGTIEYEWRPLLGVNGEWWVWVNLTGNVTYVNTTSYITGNLSVINPNPGNGTHSTNYLRNDSGGLTSSVDVQYNNFTTPSAQIPGTYSTTFTGASISNGPNIQNDSTVYNTAWTNSSGQPVTGPLSTGQYESAGDYWILRGFLYFDTGGIPDEATITSAHVALVVYEDDYTDVDFNVSIQTVKPNAFHVPLVTGDYNKGNFPTWPVGGPTNCGTKNISGYSDDQWFNISVNATGRADINLTGYTKWVLRTYPDLLGSAPGASVNEWIQFYAPGGVTPEYGPRLVVNYTVPSSNWQHIVNLTFYTNESGVWNPYNTTWVQSNGTVTVPAPGFDGNDTYWWNCSWNSNHTNYGNSSIWTFTTVNTTGGSSSVIISVNGRSYILYFTIGIYGGMTIGMVLWKRKRGRKNEV